MGVPLIQKYRISRYIYRQKAVGRSRFPLVLMLEPLFRCNLSCSGCGKTTWPEEVLDKRLSAEECQAAAEECGAPVVSIAGGESLIHEEMPQIVTRLTGLKRFVYLCTNGILLKKKLAQYSPSPYLTFSVHLDGCRELHDRLAGKEGVFDSAVNSMLLLRNRGFRFTVNCTIYNGVSAAQAGEFFDFVMRLGAEGITVSPGYDYPGAPQKGLFLKRAESKILFREIFRLGRNRRWRFNHTSFFIDFLSGNRSYQCTPWSTVTRNIYGWQKPCYLFADGYAESVRALLEETEWDRYGPGINPKCEHCMLHSGFEGTAVNDMISHPVQALSVYLRGPITEGPFARDTVKSGQ
jgi:hopanoid biosynthesis associated radical SAM protein HpnH